MKVMRGHIHEWRKQSAIKGGRGSASLHPFHHRDVLGKHDGPGGVQIFASRITSLIGGRSIGIHKMQSLQGLIYGF